MVGTPSEVPVVVHAHDERVAPGLYQRGNFIRERRETADVFAEFLPVQINIRLVIRRAEIDKQPVAGGGGGRVEFGAIPDGALVVIQLVVLRIPVAGHIQGGAGVEVVFLKLRFVLGLMVERKAAGNPRTRIVRLPSVIVKTRIVRIHDDMPLAVQAGGVAGEGVGDNGFRAGRSRFA